MSLVICNVLGEERTAVKVWPDGSYTCPWCGAAVIPGETKPFGPDRPCGNPWCEAGGASVEQVLERRRRAAEEKARREATERRTAELARWNEEARQRRAQEEQELAEAGQCVVCFRRSGGRRRVRHRRPDFHSR